MESVFLLKNTYRTKSKWKKKEILRKREKQKRKPRSHFEYKQH
jgi:hypothetical protein